MGLQIKEILAVGERILSEKGIADYKTDAEILLCHETHYDAKKIFMNWAKELDDEYCEAFFAAIERRAGGEPTQYITQSQAFMGHNFFVNSLVLIPRADTETLVETVCEYLDKNKAAQRVLDLCTGSGCIAISLAKHAAALKITASDIDQGALSVAQKNSVNLGTSGRIKFLESDMFSGFKAGSRGQKYDVIVSNPPYIRTDTLPRLQREIYEHEPLHALDGGIDGLDYYRRIAEQSHEFFRKGGALFLEIGADQAPAVKALLEATGKYKDITIKQDLAGHDRVISARVE
jgi:release factor glutamine methyltransferase